MNNSEEKLRDIKIVLTSKRRELSSLREKLAAERITIKPSKVKVDGIISLMGRLKAEIEVELPGIKKKIETVVKKEVEKEKAKPALIAEQKSIIAQLKKESAALLELLEKSVEINSRIRDLNAKYLLLEKQAESELDRSHTSSGFQTIEMMRNVLKDEIDGVGRTIVFWPPLQRRFRL